MRASAARSGSRQRLAGQAVTPRRALVPLYIVYMPTLLDTSLRRPRFGPCERHSWALNDVTAPLFPHDGTRCDAAGSDLNLWPQVRATAWGSTMRNSELSPSPDSAAQQPSCLPPPPPLPRKDVPLRPLSSVAMTCAASPPPCQDVPSRTLVAVAGADQLLHAAEVLDFAELYCSKV